MKKHLLAILVIFAFLTGLALAWALKERPDAHTAVADAGVPRRVITMSPAITEIVFALHAGDNVVGVSDYTVWPPAAKKLPSCGGTINPDFELITSLEPDLVLLQGRNEKAAAHFKKVGTNYLNVRLDDMDSIASAAGTIGARLGKAAHGARLAKHVLAYRDMVSRVTAGESGKKVLIVTWRKAGELAGIGTIGAGGFLDEAVIAAGGENIFADSLAPYPNVSLEAVMEKNPDVIIEMRPGEDLGNGLMEKIRDDWNAAPSIPAVKRGNVFVLSDDFLMIPGPRVVRLMERLWEIIQMEVDFGG